MLSAGDSVRVRQVPEGCVEDGHFVRVEDVPRSASPATVPSPFRPGQGSLARRKTQRSNPFKMINIHKLKNQYLTVDLTQFIG